MTSPISARVLVAALAAAGLVTISGSATAQPTTSGITGRALDPSGAVLPGVRVTALHLESGLVREAESGLTGEFVLPAVPVGAYEVSASLAGFRPLVAAYHRGAGRAGRALAHARARRDRRGHGGGGRHGRPDARRAARLPGERGGGRRPAAQRPQLHRPRVPAARRPELPAPRRRLDRRARARRERQRPGPALERVPARRHADERLHERPRRQRGEHVARHRDGARVPGRDERLLGRVRPQLRRPGQRGHEVRAERLARAASTSTTATTRSTPATSSTRTRSPTSAATSSAATLAGPLRNGTRPSSSSATRACASGSGRRSRPSCPTRRRARASCRPRGGGTITVPVSTDVRPYLDEFPLPNGAEPRRRPRGLHVPVRPDDRPGSLPGPARPEPRRARTRLFVRYTLRPRRAGAADRLPAVPAHVRVDATSS